MNNILSDFEPCIFLSIVCAGLCVPGQSSYKSIFVVYTERRVGVSCSEYGIPKRWCLKDFVLTLTLLRNITCDEGGLHMLLSIIALCSVAVSIVTQRCTQKNIEDTNVYPRCGTNVKVE